MSHQDRTNPGSKHIVKSYGQYQDLDSSGYTPDTTRCEDCKRFMGHADKALDLILCSSKEMATEYDRDLCNDKMTQELMDEGNIEITAPWQIHERCSCFVENKKPVKVKKLRAIPKNPIWRDKTVTQKYNKIFRME